MTPEQLIDKYKVYCASSSRIHVTTNPLNPKSIILKHNINNVYEKISRLEQRF